VDVSNQVGQADPASWVRLGILALIR